MLWLLSLAAGLLAVPLGFLLGIALAYGWLACRGVSEHEGRRGLLAGAVGGPIGALVAFYVAFRTCWWLLEGGGGAWRGFLAGCLIGVPAAAISAAVALYVGARRREARKAGGHPGPPLYSLAIPTAVLTLAVGFVAGWWLTRP